MLIPEAIVKVARDLWGEEMSHEDAERGLMEFPSTKSEAEENAEYVRALTTLKQFTTENSGLGENTEDKRDIPQDEHETTIDESLDIQQDDTKEQVHQQISPNTRDIVVAYLLEKVMLLALRHVSL